MSVSHCHVRSFATPWTVAHQAPLSMRISKQEYWNGPFPSSGDLPDPRIEHRSPALQTDSLPSEPWGKPYSKSFQLSILYMVVCRCQPQFLNLSLLPFPPGNHSLSSTSVTLFLFRKCACICTIFLDSTYKWYHMISFLLCLTFHSV